MDRTRQGVRWGIWWAVFGAFCFLLGSIVGWSLHGWLPNVRLPFEAIGPQPQPSVTQLAQGDVPEALREKFALFWQVWDLVEQHFYDPKAIDYQKMVYGAIQGMVGSLGDPYTFFSTPQQTEIVRTQLQGEYEGIGAYIDQEEGWPVIQGPVSDDVPAARAGLRQGDIILEVDHVSTQGMPLEQVIARIKGPAGSRVTLTILRGDQPPFEVTLVRARIEVASVTWRMRPDGLAYVRLSIFGGATAEELDNALETLLAAHPKGLILDLRGNGGGYLTAAQEVLGRFLDRGTAAYQANRDGSLTPHPILRGRIRVLDLPMVVLVNGGSASASEIVAGALQDNGRAVLIGEQTFGKGLIQSNFDLPDGSSVRVTVARWLTPNGRQIQGQGLTPDLIVPLPPEDYEAGRDPQLDAAAAYLLQKPLPPSAATPTPTPATTPTAAPTP
ncbi:MAG: S41 family peptidase [Chloroflexia bacterium]